MGGFPFFPRQVSDLAPRVDALMGFMLAVCAFFSLLIAALIVYFSLKYHHRRKADRSNPPSFNLALEIFWTAVPMLLSLGMFAWGTEVFLIGREPPGDAMDVYVVAKQWMWKLQHPEGRREIDSLHVPLGRSVRLLMTSQDVIHSFYVPGFRLKQDVLPGRYTTLWFRARTPGRFHLFCAEYCGTSHSGMIGWVTVMPPAEYARWLEGEGGAPGESLPQAGERLFDSLGCATCHRSPGQSSAPVLDGLYGGKVALEGGGTAVADEDYIRESIVAPAAKVVRGYRPIMPSFQGQLDEEKVQQLVSYIKSLEKRP